MKKQSFTPLWLILIFVLIMSAACNKTQPTETAEATETVNTEETASGAINKLTDVKQAVVQIEAQGTFLDPEFGLQVNSAGRGSGFIISPDGLAVTNNHVVTGAALVKVYVSGKSEPLNAKIVAYSECNDLALIDIEGGGYPYLDWYDGEVSTGMEVYLAGYPLGEPEFSLTKGIISKETAPGNTSWTSISGGVLGHDATGNPGNSGGPLVTSDGKVVGVHFASRSDADQYFAIKASTAEAVIENLKQGKNFESLGINGSTVSNEDGSIVGVWAASVASGSPADKAGVKAGDIINQMEGLVVATDGTMKDYCDIIRTHQEDSPLAITVLRWPTGEVLEGQLNGRELEVTGTIDNSSSGSESGSTDTSGSETASTEATPEPFFTDEFDNDTDNYSYFMMNGDDSQMNLSTENGKLVFELNGEYLWPYVTYDPYTYTDVRVDFEAENLGSNNNNVSIICRYDPDRGWYEFNVGNDGLYNILYYDQLGTGDYVNLFNGGSYAINMGKASNTYTAICQGDALSLYINGELARTVHHSDLKEGLIGFSVSSFDNYPVRVDIDWLQISEP